jgi:hypothetical protein
MSSQPKTKHPLLRRQSHVNHYHKENYHLVVITLVNTLNYHHINDHKSNRRLIFPETRKNLNNSTIELIITIFTTTHHILKRSTHHYHNFKHKNTIITTYQENTKNSSHTQNEAPITTTTSITKIQLLPQTRKTLRTHRTRKQSAHYHRTNHHLVINLFADTSLPST